MTVVLINLAISLAVLVRLYLRGGTRNVLVSVAAVFVFFSFGPLINLVVGTSVYEGIVTEQIPRASTGFALALVAMAIGDLVAPQRRTFDKARLARPAKAYELLPVVLAGLAVYALFVVVSKGPDMIDLDKLERLALAGPWHGGYLLLEAFALSMYFIAKRTRLTRNVYWVNAGLYLAYCLATAERDFIFIFFSLLIQAQLLKNRAGSTRIVLAGVGFFVLASFLAAARQSQDVSMEQALNQGSITFVDTFVMNIVPHYVPYYSGATYLDNLLGVLPSWLSVKSAPSLGEWLVSLHAPGSGGGYGFSLTGEAYLNFGLPAIPVVFFLITLVHRFIVNRSDRSDWWTYLNVLFVATLMYSLRGDSLQLMKVIAYGAAFFAVCHLLSSSRTSGSPPDSDRFTAAYGEVSTDKHDRSREDGDRVIARRTWNLSERRERCRTRVQGVGSSSPGRVRTGGSVSAAGCDAGPGDSG
ncbi:O-antigen polysaccharide polymerase Wzy [Saccharothrix sp.]|uniref:O-antigen polysaccharide polymerase Wzy n=1 Tax=Saccharothrix sp. TaxID=1873460 RepID=UPI00281111D5|nr:O-antigen polysaccharide polymerase Wzy [Saccharothrix sp.]